MKAQHNNKLRITRIARINRLLSTKTIREIRSREKEHDVKVFLPQ